MLFRRPRVLQAFLFSVLCQHSNSQEFDYIILGGGTAGLTVANRLSELPNIQVAVIEAGGSVYNNPNVTNSDDFTVALGTPIDWQYESTSQPYAAGQMIEYHSGKALGGTSTINGQEAQLFILETALLTSGRHDICPRRKGPDRLLGKHRQRRLELGLTIPILREKRGFHYSHSGATCCRSIVRTGISWRSRASESWLPLRSTKWIYPRDY